MMCVIGLDALAPDLAEACEEEFQRQEESEDEGVFWYFREFFGGVDLTVPSPRAQVVLACFANRGCPVSGLRFGASLYPDNNPLWPVHSYQACVFYTLRALDILMGVNEVIYMEPATEEFELSSEGKVLLHMAEHIISVNDLTDSVCPKTLAYVHRNLYATQNTGNHESQ